MTLGEKISSLRKRHKLTQEQFAKKIEITRSALAKYETNKAEPDIKTLTKIANFFEVSVDYLLGREQHSGAQIDIKEALENKKATWGGQELTPEQREILTEFFTMIRDRIKEEKKIEDENDSTGEKKLIKSIELLA
jgi:transcriptional regulator with XRE-family HTH domain